MGYLITATSGDPAVCQNVLSPLYTFSHLVHKITQRGLLIYYPRFPGKETEAQRGQGEVLIWVCVVPKLMLLSLCHPISLQLKPALFLKVLPFSV